MVAVMARVRAKVDSTPGKLDSKKIQPLLLDEPEQAYEQIKRLLSRAARNPAQLSELVNRRALERVYSCA